MIHCSLVVSPHWLLNWIGLDKRGFKLNLNNFKIQLKLESLLVLFTILFGEFYR